MAIRNILKKGDDLLLKKSREVDRFDARLAMLLDDMADTMRAENGAGLAAVQVGVLKRAFVAETENGVIDMVNPLLIYREGVQEEGEGCLSVPGEYGITSRPAVVKVKAQDRKGKWHIYKAEGLRARCFCHEIDHLDGILFTERIIRRIPEEE
ncbi:MAG TPA: peptide deformylase [Clostridiales bacterium]|nr:peptide deformylase [Clostridiales bacterium]HQH63827.1 peptide deformylase [Clostridiales bacterium]HQK74401.1 peptide deformylase [Clostridiales bacterium]